jgi:hypothetical protein
MPVIGCRDGLEAGVVTGRAVEQLAAAQRLGPILEPAKA